MRFIINQHLTLTTYIDDKQQKAVAARINKIGPEKSAIASKLTYVWITEQARRRNKPRKMYVLAKQETYHGSSATRSFTFQPPPEEDARFIHRINSLKKKCD